MIKQRAYRLKEAHNNIPAKTELSYSEETHRWIYDDEQGKLVIHNEDIDTIDIVEKAIDFSFLGEPIYHDDDVYIVARYVDCSKTKEFRDAELGSVKKTEWCKESAVALPSFYALFKNEDDANKYSQRFIEEELKYTQEMMVLDKQRVLKNILSLDSDSSDKILSDDTAEMFNEMLDFFTEKQVELARKFDEGDDDSELDDIDMVKKDFNSLPDNIKNLFKKHGLDATNLSDDDITTHYKKINIDNIEDDEDLREILIEGCVEHVIDTLNNKNEPITEEEIICIREVVSEQIDAQDMNVIRKSQTGIVLQTEDIYKRIIERRGTKAIRYEEFEKISGYVIENGIPVFIQDIPSNDETKVIYCTEKQALSAIAFAKLSHIVSRANYLIGERVDWTNSEQFKFMIACDPKEGLKLGSVTSYYSPLVFLDKIDCVTSFREHKDLWAAYYQL